MIHAGHGVWLGGDDEWELGVGRWEWEVFWCM